MMSRTQFIKIAFLTPRPGIALDAFYAHWREVHGPLVSASPGYAVYRTRYAQNHYVEDGPVGGRFPYPGMAEFRLPGPNEEEFSTTAIYRDRIRVDEEKFIDMNATVSMTAIEEVPIEGKGEVKLIIICKRRGDRETVGFTDEVGGPYVTTVLKTRDFADRLRGWSFNHVIEGSYRLPGARPIGFAGVDCVQELWFDSPDDLKAAYASAGYRNTIQAMGQRLFSKEHCSSFVAREFVFFDNGLPVSR